MLPTFPSSIIPQQVCDTQLGGTQWGHGVPEAWHGDAPSPTEAHPSWGGPSGVIRRPKPGTGMPPAPAEAHPTPLDRSAPAWGWEENWVSDVTMEMLKEMLKQRRHSPALQNPLKINQPRHPLSPAGDGAGGLSLLGAESGVAAAQSSSTCAGR